MLQVFTTIGGFLEGNDLNSALLCNIPGGWSSVTLALKELPY